MAPRSVFSVTFTLTLAPGRKPMRSRRAGRKEGAETLMLYPPGNNPLAEKNPASSVKTVRLRAAAPMTSTIAPICGTPVALRTCPEIAPGCCAAHTGSVRPNSTAQVPNLRRITPPPLGSSSRLLHGERGRRVSRLLGDVVVHFIFYRSYAAAQS